MASAGPREDEKTHDCSLGGCPEKLAWPLGQFLNVSLLGLKRKIFRYVFQRVSGAILDKLWRPKRPKPGALTLRRRNGYSPPAMIADQGPKQ